MRSSMDEAVSFAILDLETGNAMAFYQGKEDAESALRLTIQAHPEEAENLMLVGYDKIGHACGRIPGPSLLSPA